jgi:hypothetical protein
VSSRSAGYVDDDPGSPPPYFKNAPRAWTKGRTITIEIEQADGPTKVASLGYRIEGDSVYLWPYNISGGQRGTSRLTVDLQGEDLSDRWQERVYWVSGDSCYPIGHSAFWDRSLREPAHRTKIAFSPAPE